MRIRTDFVTRPPRISMRELEELWQKQEKQNPPFIDIKTLAEIKKTNREKDYAVIGELARLMSNPRDQLLYSRSARDLILLAENYPAIVEELQDIRPVLQIIKEGVQRLEEALDAERRNLIHANERRLNKYINAAENWLKIWPSVEKEITGRTLIEAHKIVADRAEGVLPFSLEGTSYV